MATREKSAPVDRTARPLVRDYMILCEVALVFLALILAGAGFDWWSVLPLLFGSIGLVAGWSIGPALVLFCLVVLLSLRAQFLGHASLARSSAMLDLLTAGVTLIYLAGAMRLLSLMRHTIPPDVRRSLPPPGPARPRPVAAAEGGDCTLRHRRCIAGDRCPADGRPGVRAGCRSGVVPHVRRAAAGMAR